MRVLFVSPILDSILYNLDRQQKNNNNMVYNFPTYSTTPQTQSPEFLFNKDTSNLPRQKNINNKHISRLLPLQIQIPPLTNKTHRITPIRIIQPIQKILALGRNRLHAIDHRDIEEPRPESRSTTAA